MEVISKEKVEEGQTPQQQQENKKAAAKKKKQEAAAAANVPLPEFVPHRIRLFEELKEKQLQESIAKDVKIKILLPDGREMEGVAGVTTPLNIAESISRNLRDNTVVAKVNGELWDAVRPLEGDCSMELLTFDSEEGRKVFWHSSAHILGQALERKYGCLLCTGPPLAEGGFFYEARMPQPDLSISSEDFPAIQKIVDTIIKEKQPFERLSVPKDVALEMFQYNPYKARILASKVPEGGHCTVYRCGTLVDPCRGPHVPSTAFVKALKVTMASSSYWQGKAENDVLQRVFGISFRSQKELKEHLELLEKAKQRDHRNVGKAQELFFFHPLSPGSCFFLPHGARIYNKLLSFLRAEYRNRGFDEVITPNMYNSKLWEVSGHWQNYKDNMFTFEVEQQPFALKPMNCPGHCLMFKHRTRSHRELPIRFADFGVLHRNELSGTLTGLTRVRRFQQDDAHIFCAPDQIEKEINSCLEFMQHVYGIFGFEFDLELSTRPEKYLGEVELWNKAEEQLKVVLDNFGKPWKLNPGDGAFYGPKIDIHIRDALKRSHQCATIQLDFQLPIRFELDFQGSSEELVRPVMIHRAIFGSVERFMAILIEHTGGKWPFWISPRQLIVIPIAKDHHEYAEQVRQRLHDAGYYAEVELSGKSLEKKVREAQLAQFNFILVVGAEEVASQSVNVRTRDSEKKERGKPVPLNEFLQQLEDLVKSHQ